MKIKFANNENWAKKLTFINGDTEVVDTIEECDLVVFTGGQDINPEIYFHPLSKTTSYSDIRDKTEIAVYREAVRRGKPMFGICRGAQLLTALNGGKIIQDIDNHTSGNHPVFIKENSFISKTTSCHHQMMFPYNLHKSNYIVLASSLSNQSSHYTWQDDKTLSWEGKAITEGFNEPELVYYPKSNSLGVQGHPEWMDSNSSYCTYIAKCIDRMLEVNGCTKSQLTDIEGLPMLEEQEVMS